MIFDLLAPLVVGLFGSLHCLGMCGPLVAAYSLHLRSMPSDAASGRAATGLWSRGLAHHLAFHGGRIMCYGLLGGAASAWGYMAGFGHFFSGLRSGATLVGGVLMLLFGVALLKLLPLSRVSTPWLRPGGIVRRALPRLLASDTIASRWLLGFLAGLLPCMLSWAMIVKAATAVNPVHGFMIMLLFGLGTVPALFFTGLSASMLTLRMRLAGERVAALSVMVMGFILLVKGAKYFA